jgi:hypothetical protein
MGRVGREPALLSQARPKTASNDRAADFTGLIDGQIVEAVLFFSTDKVLHTLVRPC